MWRRGAAEQAVAEKTAVEATTATRRRSGPTATDEGRCKLLLSLLLFCKFINELTFFDFILFHDRMIRRERRRRKRRRW